MNKLILCLLVLILISPLINAYNVSITPSTYDFTYNGDSQTLNFKVCQDSGSTQIVSLITEVSSDTLNNIAKVRIKSPAYLKVPTNCENFPVLLSTVSGYNKTTISIKVRYFNNYSLANNPVSNNTLSNLNAVANQIKTINETKILNTNSTTASVTKKPNRTIQMIAIISIVIAVFGIVAWYLTHQNENAPA